MFFHHRILDGCSPWQENDNKLVNQRTFFFFLIQGKWEEKLCTYIYIYEPLKALLRASASAPGEKVMGAMRVAIVDYDFLRKGFGMLDRVWFPTLYL